MPDFTPSTCSVPEYPEKLDYSLSGLVDGSLVICGGKFTFLRITGLIPSSSLKLKLTGKDGIILSCHSLKEAGWVEIGNLEDSRKQAAASVTPDGKMIVTGGSDGDIHLSSTEIYSNGQWTCTTPSPVGHKCIASG